MSYIRATIKLVALLVATAGYYLFYLAGLAFVMPFPDTRRRWRRWGFGGWARTSTRLIKLKICPHNLPPQTPFLLVSNHLSYVDVVVLQSQTDCAFIAKSEVAGWPILGFICRTMDTIFVERSRKRDIPHALQSIERAFAHGLGVVLFAEGTSTDGHGVAPFKSSLLEFAAHNRVPVHYVTLSYETPIGEIPAAQSVCWWQDMSFGRHVFRLLKLSSFQANVKFGAEPIVSDNRRVLADQLWSAVSSQLTPAPAER